MAEPTGIEFTGLRELNASLAKIGVPDDAIKAAMSEAGAVVQQETWRLMPVASGASARTLKVSKNKNVLRVQIGSKKVASPYVMHATELGVSRGGMTFHVSSHSRRGTRGVSAYTAARRIRNFPYFFTAYERKKQAMYEAYVTAIGKLIKGA